MSFLALPVLALTLAAPNPDFAPPDPAPFGFADFRWVPGNGGASDRPLSFGPFTGELRVDTVYHHSFAQPIDDTISGSSEVFRHGEFQLTQLGIPAEIKAARGRTWTAGRPISGSPRIGSRSPWA